MTATESPRIGPYKVVRLLGKGGMGRVYEALHEETGRRVAIKLLNAGLIDDPELTRRFLNEAVATHRTPHRGLVEITEAAELPDGHPYLVMEYLDGETLHARLQEPGLPAIPIALRIARQIAEALAAVHGQGIVHRDLKPANVMLIRDPETGARDWVKVLDFGVAKLLTGHEGVQTRSGVLLGTPEYMSPEQCKNARVVTDRSDVYSLGVILYQMLVGALPFNSTSQALLLIQHIEAEVPPLRRLRPELPPSLTTLVHRMLAKSPVDRPSSAEVAEELGAQPRERTGERVPQASRRRAQPELPARVTALLVLGSLGLSMLLVVLILIVGI